MHGAPPSEDTPSPIWAACLGILAACLGILAAGLGILAPCLGILAASLGIWAACWGIWAACWGIRAACGGTWAAFLGDLGGFCSHFRGRNGDCNRYQRHHGAGSELPQRGRTSSDNQEGLAPRKGRSRSPCHDVALGRIIVLCM